MIILSRPSKTARELSRTLNIPIYYHGYNMPYDSTIIRWGNTDNLAYNTTEINTQKAIKTSSNKENSQQQLSNFGIPTPERIAINNIHDYNFPIIGRTRYHECGNGFYFCNNITDYYKALAHGITYFSKFYPKTQEYRVHIGSNKTLLVSIKENGNTASPIWNYKKSGFTFRHLHRQVWLEDETLHNMIRTAKKVLQVLELNFGAVDIMAFPTDNQPKFVISEVNTSPALSPLALSKYATYFYSLLENE